MRTIETWLPGSCGELVQGIIDGVHFHVSCPIDIFSHVRLTASPDSATCLLPKAAEAATFACRLTGLRLEDICINLSSSLKPGKGMASSTADIAAIAAAIGLAARFDLGEDILARLALEIEPTDGTIFRGIVAFDHKNGSWLKGLGGAPALKITYIDTGGMVDTIEFNGNDISYTPSQRKLIEKALAMIVIGLKEHDRQLVGEASTISALVNQDILPKPGLDELIEISREIGGYGVIVAHSGTVAGIIHELDNRAAEKAVAHLTIGSPATVRLINGGLRSCVC